jgi:hypothetical protein
VRHTAEEIFNKKLLPAAWEGAFYISGLGHNEEMLRTGEWRPRDDWIVAGKGQRVRNSTLSNQLLWPVGVGLYRHVGFCTDGKFISYKLVGGPPPNRKKAEETKEPVEESKALWNDECPCSFAESAEEGEQLRKEITDAWRDLRTQLYWRGGEPCREPNEVLAKEIAFAREIMTDLLKPQFVPAEVPDDKFLLVRDLDFTSGKEDALVVRFVKEKYILKFMKTKWQVHLTVRPVSGKAVDEKQTAEEVFNTKLIPPTWGKEFYNPSRFRNSKTMRRGEWFPQDDWTSDSKGYRVQKSIRTSQIVYPVGIGPYRMAAFCTNGKFAGYAFVGGAPVRRKRVEKKKEPDK